MRARLPTCSEQPCTSFTWWTTPSHQPRAARCTPALPADYLEDVDRLTRAELEAQLTREEKARYSAVFVMRLGAPARQILDYLKEHGDIDLIVMATAGRGSRRPVHVRKRRRQDRPRRFMSRAYAPPA